MDAIATAIACKIAGEFKMASPQEKGRVWCLTLSIADVFAQNQADFNRAGFYAIALGDSDHFAVRNSFTKLWVEA